MPRVFQVLRRWYNERHPLSEDNDLRGARDNIARHYDLSNELFTAFLDESLTYSSALFESPAGGGKDGRTSVPRARAGRSRDT